MAKTNLETIQEIYRAVAQGDINGVLCHLSEEITACQASSLPYGGQYRGKIGFSQMATAIFDTWADFQPTPQTWFSTDPYVLVLAEMTGTARSSGRAFAMPLAELWTLHNGQVTDIRPFYWDTAQANQLLETSSQSA